MTSTRSRFPLWGGLWALLLLSPGGCDIQDGQFDGSLIFDAVAGGISDAVSNLVEALALIVLI